MGPVSRCVGPFVPPAQPFQNPLPPTPATLPNFNLVQNAIKTAIFTNTTVLPADMYNNQAYYGAVFVHLAWQCSSTFRHTDYQGGCNGARIRFPPQTSWPMNVALDKALLILAPIQSQFVNLSWADLIVLAGNTALDIADNTSPMKFCGGRTDAADGTGSMLLQPNGNYSLNFEEIRLNAQQVGLSDREIVALSARLRSPGQMMRSGFYGTWTQTGVGSLSNQYFITLLTETWVAFTTPGGELEYKAEGKELYMTPSDLNLKWDSTYLAIAQEYASDNTLFLKEFRSAWTHLMNKDRFDGPTGNVCH